MILGKWNEAHFRGCCVDFWRTCLSNGCDTRHQILRDMLHVRLHTRRVQRFIMPEVLQIERIVLKMGLIHHHQHSSIRTYQ